MHHLCHCYISVSSDIGPGFLIGHVGGIVIGSKTKIGKNCDIRQNVTTGGNFSKTGSNGQTQPIIKDNVSISVGACILGPITVGENSIIGANSVVTRDIPKNSIVSGIPAVKIKDRWKKSLNRGL